MFRFRRKRGFVLIATAIAVVALAGILGLAVDLGRGYIVKNEAQAFTDSAALAAALKLDGALTGITAAKSQVTTSTNQYYFGTKSFTTLTTEFSTDKTTWLQNPTTGTGYRYVRVTAREPSLTVLFARVAGAASGMSIGARSMAGVETATSYGQGVFPFAPIAHGPTGPNFGYSFGDELTLLWPSSVQSNGSQQQMNNLCQSDRNAQALADVKAGVTSERGYIQETSASALAAAIEDDYMNYTVSLGMGVNRTGGIKTTDVYQSLDDRVSQDTSPDTSGYSDYMANHDAAPLRRVVIVPVIGDAVNATVVGFVKVLLPPKQPHNPNKSKCAMYIGPADLPTGNLGSGANLVRILE